MGVTINDLEEKDILTGEEYIEIDTNGFSQKAKAKDIASILGGASITIDKELSETSNNAIANSAVTMALGEKVSAEEVTSSVPTVDFPQVLHTPQNLTNEQKSVARDNIYAMANTPSGDPIHYAYEAIGAVWNASTGYWEFIGVKDMTNEDMLEEILLGNSRIYPSANVINLSRTERVIFGKEYMLLDSEWTALKATNLTPFNERLEVVQFSTYEHLPVFLSSFEWSCYGCKRLRTFFNILDVSMGGLDSAFIGCVSLETIMLRGLKKDVSFADSPLLSKESLLYMIENCTSGVSFTITLHPDVYEKCQEFGEWFGIIDQAVLAAYEDKGSTITLASA